MRSRLFLSAGLMFVLTASAVSAAITGGPMMGPIMGPAKTIKRPAFLGYYDGHRTPI